MTLRFVDFAELTAGQRADAARVLRDLFYQKLGYEIVGLIPDANGPGKPDIMMARRL